VFSMFYTHVSMHLPYYYIVYVTKVNMMLDGRDKDVLSENFSFQFYK